MKTKITLLLLLALALLQPATAQVKREQRGVWMSAFVGDWPSTPITTGNQKVLKATCQKMLDTLAANNMNTVYYHVRAMSDAMYNSAYEPWSSYVSGTRGVAPAFDPLAWIVQEGHKRGIEIYAWVNPYRYAPKSTKWGESPLDYINTHPDWLMTTDYETCLNPGIDSVRQRVVDVCRDIITKYDVDGLVFDDYFYNQDGSPMDLDSVQYNAYKRGGGTMSQADWRRENVNKMVHDVNAMIKQVKPWVRFGIGPAGVVCTSPEVAAKYGVDPSPGRDWQYDQIYSDPMAWITRGTVDFMSPQVYWNTAGNYDEVTTWWGRIGKKFNRHVYISQTCSSVGKTGWDFDEMCKQVDVARQAGCQGMIYFKYTTWRYNNHTIDGKVWGLREYLKKHSFTTPSLSPAVTWQKTPQSYGAVTGSKIDGDTLSWDSIPNVRYVVYAIPDSVADSQFSCQPQYLLGITYSPRYVVKQAYRSGYRYAVTVLDRWEREYAPVLAGATASQAPKPQLTAPADGATVTLLSHLKWQGNGSIYKLNIYSNPGLDTLVAQVETSAASYPLARLAALQQGKTYYWQVTASGLNLNESTSDVHRFTIAPLSITSPASGATAVDLTPAIAWTAAGDSTVYTLIVSDNSDLKAPVVAISTTHTSYTVPAFKLAGGTTYYAQVTARDGANSVASSIMSFTTRDVALTAPLLVTPAADSLTLYSNSRIAVEPQAGAQSLRIEMSTSTSFPPRSSYKATIAGSFESIPLGQINGVGKPVDGKRYYVRARYAYLTAATGTTVQYTPYSLVRTFTYRDCRQGDVNSDGVVNVSDVTTLINMILGTTATDATVADLNADGTINVSDVTTLINFILSGSDDDKILKNN